MRLASIFKKAVYDSKQAGLLRFILHTRSLKMMNHPIVPAKAKITTIKMMSEAVANFVSICTLYHAKTRRAAVFL